MSREEMQKYNKRKGGKGEEQRRKKEKLEEERGIKEEPRNRKKLKINLLTQKMQNSWL